MTRVCTYLTWVEQARGLSFGADYHALWRWSVGGLPGFWGSLAEYMGVRFRDQPATVLTGAAMPGAEWFPGATLNFAEHALAGPGRRPPCWSPAPRPARGSR